MPEGGSPRRVALVHDFLLDLRGAERVFLALCDLYPDADLFTAVYDERGTEGRFRDRRVHTSFLQRLKPTARTFRPLLPLYPYAVEAMDLRGYDLVISSSSAWAHGVLVDEDAVHVCYCYNPFRYAWNARDATLRDRGFLQRALLGAILQRWRQWDWIAAQRVDSYLTISETTQRRVSRYFGRDSKVIHPPVEIERFKPAPLGDYYLVLSALMPHKRIDLAVEAFNRLGLPLVVAGGGPDARRLRRMACRNVRFLGRVSDAAAAAVLASARALVLPATEEFGIAAVEAQAAGRPVIALRQGGARETVVEGVTGTFFERPEVGSLMEAVLRFDPLAIDAANCIANAARFSVSRFHAQIAEAVAEAMAGNERAPDRRTRPARPRGLTTRRIPVQV